ncbi:MAG: HAD family hydrolase [Ornithinimicrobium sp.]
MADEGGTRVRAVIFDWGGTLTPWHTVDVAGIWRRTYAERAYPDNPAAATALAQALTEVDAELWAWGRTEHRSARLGDVLAGSAQRLQIPVEQVATAPGHTAYESEWEPHTFTDPDVAPLWTWLRSQGIAVGVLSNTIWSRDYHRGVFARDGVLHLIDADVYTSEIEVVKPHADAFRLAAEAVEVDPSECVYVGDRLYEDVWGPQQVGMRAIHIPHSTIPEEQVVPVDVTPDATAHALAEVAGIVAGWQSAPSARPR